MATFHLGLILLLQIYQATGYSRGPPSTTCFTQYPKHKASTQTSPSPFVVTFNPPKYRPGEDVTIIVEEQDGLEFRGIQIAARRDTENTEEIVGRFVEHMTNKTKSFNCFGGFQNMLTHANGDPVTSMEFKWRAPNDNVGNVTFRATFVRAFKEFWHDIPTPLEVDSSAPLKESTYPAIPLTPQTKSINFDDCGETKGCFYYPRKCSGSDCKAAATFRHRKSTKDFLVELYLNHDDAKWVAIGFSDDQKMGDDLTVACTSGVGLMSVQEGYNPGIYKYNERLFSLFTSSQEIMSMDGKIQCRFVIPETVNVYSIDQSVTNAFSYTNRKWNLLEDWYLLMAWGNSMPESNTITYHRERPVVSSDKADLTEDTIIFASTFHSKVQAHATLMIVAWVLCAGIVTVISRHYRDWMVNRTMCGSPLWFQIHRIMAVLVAALTVVGIIIIFEHYGTGIRDIATPHAYVGLATVGCVGLQLICGMLRPHLEHSFRPMFNIGHRFTGHAAHILAAATMFLAYKIDYINEDMRDFGIITLSVWVGVQVFWHVMFEIIKRFRSKSDRSNTYKIGDNDLTPDQEPKGSDDCPHTTTLVTYILTLIGVCALVIVPIYQY